MIDVELRSQGVGGSEVAAVLGLDPRRDAFSVYSQKVGLFKSAPPTIRMRRGKYFERGVIDWYADVTGRKTEWFDQTVQNPLRSWQVVSPDAFVLNAEGLREAGIDAKTVAWDQRENWGDAGTDAVPPHIALQCQWTCSTLDMPWWDVAALMGLDDLLIYRIHRDAQIEAILLEEIEAFWRKNVMARVPPAPSFAPAACEALKQMFPKNISTIRVATAEELPLVEALKTAKIAYKRAEQAKDQAENRIKLAIGEADGLMAGGEKISWRKDADTIGTAWDAVAQDLGLAVSAVRAICSRATVGGLSGNLRDAILEVLPPEIKTLEAEHQIVTRQGPRKLLTPRGWVRE